MFVFVCCLVPCHVVCRASLLVFFFFCLSFVTCRHLSLVVGCPSLCCALLFCVVWCVWLCAFWEREGVCIEHAPRVYVQNALRVYQHHAHMFETCVWAWCQYTRGRFERTHGFFSAFHGTHHTTPHRAHHDHSHTTQNHSHRHTTTTTTTTTHNDTTNQTTTPPNQPAAQFASTRKNLTGLDTARLDRLIALSSCGGAWPFS